MTNPVSAPASRALLAGMVAGLLCATIAVYLPTGSHGFVRLDDPAYITENPKVLAGLTADGAKWAFTTGHIANWHPLTWLSHMLDVELFGTDAGRHHIVSAGLHGLNAALLFLALHAATGALWRSGCVAALFAVHPLHVESVAWAAERKDLLCALFWILSTWAYVAWTRRKGALLYAATALSLLLALLSKPMAVTAPLTFLVLDYWPLGRIGRNGGEAGERPGTPLRRLVVEKAPLLLLSAASSAVTILVQRAGGAIRAFEPYPPGARLANAAVSYVAYLWKTAVPVDLAVYYPHPLDGAGGLPPLEVAAAAAFLLAVTAAAVRYARRFPPLLAGWAWYLLTLLPVIGIVQAGDQAMADRYAYMPVVGVFIVLAWGGEELFRGRRGLRWAAPAAGIAAISAAAILAHGQTGHWKDSLSLYRRALSVTRGNWLIHYNLGCYLQDRGEYPEAISHFRETLKVRPDEPSALVNLGFSLSRLGDDDGAIAAYRRAVEVKPDYQEARVNLGNALLRRGYTGEAISRLREASAVRPEDGTAQLALAAALSQGGFHQEAENRYRELLRKQPGNADAHNDLGVLFARQGRNDDALLHFREALRFSPGHPDATNNLRRMSGILDRKRGGR